MDTVRTVTSATLLAALLTGFTFLRVPSAFACSYVPGFDVAAITESASVIVIARVSEVRERRSVTFEPEAYLKGPAASRLEFDSYESTTCPLADFESGERVLIFTFDDDEERWPQDYHTIRLRQGFAEHDWNGFERISEAEFVNDLRVLTGQYAVPAAATGDDGAGIDWGTTVIPVTIALLAIFGVGLVLMRIWHRIDPS
jgi:hypothetical protein